MLRKWRDVRIKKLDISVYHWTTNIKKVNSVEKPEFNSIEIISATSLKRLHSLLPLSVSPHFLFSRPILELAKTDIHCC